MASSAPLAAASAAPLRMRFAKNAANKRSALPWGTMHSRPISTTIKTPVMINRFRLPIRSARAPDGTSNRTMVAAQTAFNSAKGAFLVFEWIGKLAKPILWLIGVATIVIAAYERLKSHH